MKDTILGKIIIYISIWIGLFLVLCIVSVIKNWSILAAVISVTIADSIEYGVGYVLVIGLMIYGIRMIIGSVRR